jgi:hypothetical protein
MKKTASLVFLMVVVGFLFDSANGGINAIKNMNTSLKAKDIRAAVKPVRLAKTYGMKTQLSS